MDQLREDVEMVYFLDHQVSLNYIKSRTEVHGKYSDKVAQGIQMLRKDVYQAGYSILPAPLSAVVKLEEVELWGDDG